VRFVFFSGIPDQEFKRLEERVNRGSYRLQDGILGWTLARLGPRSRERRVNFEDEYWRDLRPHAFSPFSNVSQIEAHLSWECRTKTAMPGSEESLRFAQRLGIGRYVPCILVFTDIGDLKVHVLPFDGRTADQIYRRVREWVVDSYYEINRGILDHWSSLEGQIRRLTLDAAGSLRAIRDWPDECHRDWQNLQQVAELVRTLAEGHGAAVQQIAALAADWTQPSEVRSILRDFSTRLSDFDKQAAEVEMLKSAAAYLADQVTPEGIRRCIQTPSSRQY
jgi:hypothetical protein